VVITHKASKEVVFLLSQTVLFLEVLGVLWVVVLPRDPVMMKGAEQFVALVMS
jgi:hypothetical protein